MLKQITLTAMLMVSMVSTNAAECNDQVVGIPTPLEKCDDQVAEFIQPLLSAGYTDQAIAESIAMNSYSMGTYYTACRLSFGLYSVHTSAYVTINGSTGVGYFNGYSAVYPSGM